MGNEVFSKKKQLMYVIVAGVVILILVLIFGSKMIEKTFMVHEKQKKQRKDINKQYEAMGFSEYSESDRELKRKQRDLELKKQKMKKEEPEKKEPEKKDPLIDEFDEVQGAGISLE